MEKELIYSVEDDDNIRDLIKYTVEGAGYNIVCFSKGIDMLNAMKESIPNLILLDIMLPDLNGIEILKTIRSEYANVAIKVIMLTVKSSEINIVTGLNLGADDYISKPFSVLVLLARIKANLRKKDVKVDSEELNFGKIKLIVKKRSVFVDGKQMTLTQKEFDLLKLLILNANNVVDRETMLAEVWGIDHVIETRTIDMHIKSIRQKLSLNKENIITIRGLGYKLTES